MSSVMSLIYKSSGKAEVPGPYLVVHLTVLVGSVTVHHSVQLVGIIPVSSENEEIHSLVLPRILYWFSFSKRRQWGMETKAWEKSNMAMSDRYTWSRALAQSFMACTNWVSQECPVWKPCCRDVRILLFSKNLLMLDCTMCSRILEQIKVKEIGQ